MHESLWTDKDVAAQFEEAIYTLKRLPKPKVQGYFNLWPSMFYTTWELYQQDKKPLRLGPPLPDAIDRMEKTLDWIFWLSVEERKLVWARASRLPWKEICTMVGVSKTVAWQRWGAALNKIAKRINREYPHLVKRCEQKRALSV